MQRLKSASKLAVVLGSLALLAAACGGGGGTKNGNGGGSTSTSSPSSTAAVKSGGTITMALDENLAGFNVLTSASNEFVLQEILDIVWPASFIIEPDLNAHLNTQLLQSATETKTSPQTIVYKINPKAVWGDGTPISAADYIYNWQAQSGSTQYKDVGGKPYDDATTAGYNQIQSITSSDNGKTATVVYKTPFADWKSLFAPIVPAHIAKKVGWNTGFNNWKNVLSGSWYKVSNYVSDQYVTLTRNPKYWATPGKASSIVFRLITDDTQEPAALQNGEANIINPASASLSIVQQVAQIPGVTTKTLPGLEFEHFDFNETNAYLSQLKVRQALAYGTDRQTIINRTVGEIDHSIKPLGNRIYMPTQSQYQANGSAYGFNPSKAKSLLASAGMKMGSDGYFQPSSGPEAGKDLSFTISSTTGNALRASTEQLFQSQMKSIGVKISIHNYDAATLFGTVGPKGEFDIIEFAWVSTPFPTGNDSIYCSYTNTANCSSNWDHYANPQEDKYLTAGATASTASAEAANFNKADQILWQDMVTLPLYEKPQYFAWSNKFANVIPNTSNVGVPWNAEDWGVKAA